MKQAWLLLKNLLFTALVPSFVVGWVPLHWFERYPHWPERWGVPEFGGAALVVVATLAYLHCQWLIFHRGQGTPAPMDPPQRFLRRGLYKWLRNPMYLSVLLAVAGEALFLRSFHIAVYLVCLTCLIHVFVVLYEENALRFRFGAIYEDYRRDVSRWLPRKPRPVLETVAPFETKR